MFTIKHIDADENESIFTATSVRYQSGLGTHDAADPALKGLGYVAIDGPPGFIDDGVVYVMNDAGKTVSKYVLGDLEPVGHIP
jgi:hypothetical protein